MNVTNWGFDPSDEETIASGIPYVYFAGGVTCDAAASAASGTIGEYARPEANVNVSTTISASFSSN
jgi:hypothetical protein